MNLRLGIRSRIGNMALLIVGGIEAIAAFLVYLAYVISQWNASGFLDHVLQLTLVGSAIVAGLVCAGAAGNLSASGSVRGRRTSAAT